MACSSLVRVATLNDPKTVVRKNEDGTVTFLGLEGKLLEVIIQGLNSQFELVMAKDKAWGQLLPDGNWTGMIGEIQKGLADIAIHFMSVTEKRLSIVDYSPTYTTEVLTFAIGKPGFKPKSLAFVKAFDSRIWITTLVILLLMPLIFTVLLREKGGYSEFLLMLATHVLQQSVNHNQDRFQYRILLSSWMFFTTILSFSYTAVFFSLLTLPAELKGVQNFQELSEAVMKKGYKCYVPKGSSTVDLLLQSEKKYLRELGQNVVRNEWYINSIPLPLNNQMDKESAMISGGAWMSVAAGPEEWKHYYMSDNSLLSFQFAVAMKKGFCHKRRLMKVIHSINNGGLYEKIRNHESFKLWNSAPERRRIVARNIGSLSLSDLSGAFLLLAAGVGLSTICFLAELIFIRKA
ncbi:Glutamate receptor ionotropic, delta-1 [Araneus ventricosus]|uniref:Glutamate receptor ionotropic, delta-1 n=1 Tax=Araneus ventricosus TaxID=182803 RepID=A0A4Y2VWL9_ARAVE|nr:Glutamate receptor ionotropic, delta-1 [Araneus ventricosus]GBO28773.1 Glutamate receptor ionotropic, delta-1 [Araneus ventricosus]